MHAVSHLNHVWWSIVSIPSGPGLSVNREPLTVSSNSETLSYEMSFQFNHPTSYLRSEGSTECDEQCPPWRRAHYVMPHLLARQTQPWPRLALPRRARTLLLGGRQQRDNMCEFIYMYTYPSMLVHVRRVLEYRLGCNIARSALATMRACDETMKR